MNELTAKIFPLDTITSNPLSLVSRGLALDRQIRVCKRKSEASLVKAIIFILMLKFLAKGHRLGMDSR
jgi:hypothetical protein